MVTVTSCTNHGLIAVWYGRGWRWWWWQGPTDPLTIMPVVFEGINDSHPTVFLFFSFFFLKQTNKQTIFVVPVGGRSGLPKMQFNDQGFCQSGFSFQDVTHIKYTQLCVGSQSLSSQLIIVF